MNKRGKSIASIFLALAFASNAPADDTPISRANTRVKLLEEQRKAKARDLEDIGA
jgi:hypothetical protein